MIVAECPYQNVKDDNEETPMANATVTRQQQQQHVHGMSPRHDDFVSVTNILIYITFRLMGQ